MKPRLNLWALLTMVVGVSCASLLQLASYQDVTRELCKEAARCDPPFDEAICQQHLADSLDALSPEERHAWLTHVADTAATSTCGPAQQAIDSELFCIGVRAPCQDGVQCCHFSTTVAKEADLCPPGEGGAARQCCEAKGFACTPGDCCAGDCSEEFGCCGGECCSDFGEACDDDKLCCAGACSGGKCSAPCGGEGDTCESNEGCCDELYCNGPSGKCTNCLSVGDGCDPASGQDPACCGNACYQGSILGGEDVCSDCDGLPEGTTCDPNASSGTKQGGCCSGICDARAGQPNGTCATCRSTDSNCSGHEDQCCPDHICRGGVCSPCAPDGQNCTNAASSACCSGICLDGSCATCSTLGETCQPGDVTPCCRGNCTGTGDTGHLCCVPLLGECDSNADCCTGKSPIDCQDPAVVTPVNGETPIEEQGSRCCSTEIVSSPLPCTNTYGAPLDPALAKNDDHKNAITFACEKDFSCCCEAWTKTCLNYAIASTYCKKPIGES